MKYSENIWKIFYNNLIFPYCGPSHPLTIVAISPPPPPSQWSGSNNGLVTCRILIYLLTWREIQINCPATFPFPHWSGRIRVSVSILISRQDDNSRNSIASQFVYESKEVFTVQTRILIIFSGTKIWIFL